MFEAARPGWGGGGGTGKGVGRGGGWEGVGKRAGDRRVVVLLKRCSFYPSPVVSFCPLHPPV